jgi:DNA-binding NtrC family response regulator
MPETVVADFIAASTAMREVEQQIRLVRDSAVAVLVTGEQGVGREKVARTIHASGARHREPFVHVDCAELPPEVLAPVLFGDRDEGRFELAGTGTLFLDGVDTLSLELQEKVLRILERGTLERANGKRIVPIRARLIAATRRDLREMVDQGKFRRDLFCKLNVFPIAVPPLRKRREDIAPLAQHFLALHQHERTPSVQAIDDRAVAAFRAYHWPGNLREMETVILGAILACGNDRVIRPENLPHEIGSKAPEGPSRVETAAPVAMDDNTIVPLSELERRAIAHALKVTGGNVTRAARALGIGRATMYRKLDRFKMAGE